MSETARTWGLVLWAAAVVTTIVANMIRPGPGMEDIWPWAGGLLAFPIGALVVLVRSRRNTIGRLLAVVATAAGFDFGLTWLSVTFADQRWGAYAESFTIPASVGIFTGIFAILHLFPTGQPISVAHRRLFTAMLIWMGTAGVVGLFAPGAVGFSGRPNALGIAPAWTTTLFDLFALGLPLFGGGGLLVLFLRLRRAGPIERAQLKWFFTGAAVFAPVMFVVVLVPESGNRFWENATALVALLAFWSLPAAIVVAIVRYHLYDIDRLVSRSATYLVVAGVLTLIYVACVVALQAVVPAGSSQLSVAASTLAVAGLFAPVRSRVQQRLDRRFNRAHYEAGAITHEFARRLQQEIDLETIQTDLLRAVAGTVQPGAIQLWLSPARGSGRT